MNVCFHSGEKYKALFCAEARIPTLVLQYHSKGECLWCIVKECGNCTVETPDRIQSEDVFQSDNEECLLAEGRCYA